MTTDPNDRNGLVDGNIPAGQVCPFLEKCAMKFDRCPTKESLKPVDFSCAAARGFSYLSVKRI